jgi:hypothetical protein
VLNRSTNKHVLVQVLAGELLLASSAVLPTIRVASSTSPPITSCNNELEPGHCCCLLAICTYGSCCVEFNSSCCAWNTHWLRTNEAAHVPGCLAAPGLLLLLAETGAGQLETKLDARYASSTCRPTKLCAGLGDPAT